MEYRVKDLLKQKIMKDAAYIGNSSSLNNIISGITVLDSPDIADWLKGEEVIITSLYPVREFTDKQTFDWIERLSSKNVSALIVKIKKVFDEIPPNILKACDCFQLPIIQISNDIPFIDIMYPVMEELFNDKVKKLEYFREVHDRFTALSLADEGEDAIINTLADIIKNPVTLYDREFRCVATTDNATSLFYEMDKIMKEEGIKETKFPFYRQKVMFPSIQEQKSEQLVVVIETINHIKMNLVISELNKKVTSFDFIAIENAATALSLEFVKKFAISEVEQKFKDDLIDDLISGKQQSISSIKDRANVIGFDLENKYVAVVFHLEAKDVEMKGTKIHTEQQRYYKYLRETIEYYNKDVIVRERSNLIIVLWKVQQKDARDRNWLTKLKATVNHIHDKFKNDTKEFIIQTGIGNVAQDVNDLSQSYMEAQDSLELGKLYNQSDFSVSYSELGIYRLLYQVKDKNVLINFIPQSLEKLLNYQHAGKNDLVETLKVFIQCSQNTKKTAQELFVHYKTVTYRIERIKEISGINFEDPEEMLSVQVGFKILDVLEKEENKPV
ncbi:PucR family transcriptional regulator [Ornithinibacillus halophilus]|uniref:Transcriptional regulator, CdaR family n=1 Tax=Ornithinibacillus halophilus TaxID=930117 RepID=A0A1M5MRQ3_9BACI|nr:PucR family transcriptional regulator [Ornithinibacillus halophilus]SHG79742.1 transcriptional regulator, CdaR family [Ornithinibacillus halophilus]